MQAQAEGQASSGARVTDWNQHPLCTRHGAHPAPAQARAPSGPLDERCVHQEPSALLMTGI